MLRDAVKVNVAMIECGAQSFAEVFMPHMVISDGRRVIERVPDLLPKPEDEKVVSLPSPAVG